MLQSCILASASPRVFLNEIICTYSSLIAFVLFANPLILFLSSLASPADNRIANNNDLFFHVLSFFLAFFI